MAHLNLFGFLFIYPIMAMTSNEGSLKDQELMSQAEKHCNAIYNKTELLNLPIPKDCLYVSIDEQKMYQYKYNQFVRIYIISTAKNGASCKEGSYGTPTGIHRVKEKIGDNQPLGMVFKARQATGKRYWEHDKSYRDKDLVTSRIFWLEGLQKGLNGGAKIDSYQRYIYIHGTNHENQLGTTASHGCIRMANKEAIQLYNSFEAGGIVLIDS